MNYCEGVNYLFDVLFHENMASHPKARADLNQRLSKLYENYSPTQQQAVDELFDELCHRSFSHCFHLL